MKYAFIDEQRARHAVARLCQALDVSPSGYHAWRRRLPSPRSLANQALLVQIRASTGEPASSPRNSPSCHCLVSIHNGSRTSARRARSK